MCTHRPVDRWGRRWRTFTLTTLISFAVMEGYGLATEGYPATLSAFLHRLSGQCDRCRHVYVSRAVIVAFCCWIAVHIGWGELGWEPVHKHCRGDNVL